MFHTVYNNAKMCRTCHHQEGLMSKGWCNWGPEFHFIWHFEYSNKSNSELQDYYINQSINLYSPKIKRLILSYISSWKSKSWGGGYSRTLPIRVCAAQQGRDFEAPDLEQGIHFRGVFLGQGIIFRTHENFSFVSSHLKLFF